MTLSICIATIPEREALFNALCDELVRQAERAGLTHEVQLIIDASPRGSITIGAKRQAMNERATGQYVVHIDDDDWVAPDYIERVFEAIGSNPDCVGHYELCEGMDGGPALAVWTNAAPDWGTDTIHAKKMGAKHVRTPFHKTPIKRQIALQVPFKDISFAEDHDFSKRLKASRLIRTEAFIPRVLYIYRYHYEPHEKKYGIK
jgi:glycosyltransferase involved in cell wall biosynthesis